MTIAINAKIHDGLVLASDSATTLIDSTGQVINVYNHANKIFNLYKGLPIGAITYGLGNIGDESIERIAKDFRKELTNDINASNYEMEDVANQFHDYVSQKYNTVFSEINSNRRPRLGFIIAGYSSDSNLPEEYSINFPSHPSPQLMRPPAGVGLSWNGEIEPITRLVLGYSINTRAIIDANRHLFKSNDGVESLINDITSKSQVSLINSGMPLQDVISLCEYLVTTVINFAKFRSGAQTVGGPIEIAAITKHEGFRWVKRKHYFDSEYNQ